MKKLFTLLAMTMLFFSGVEVAFAAEAVTNGVLNNTTSWSLGGDGLYDAGTTRTADGSGASYVNSLGRNNQATGSLTQTLATPIPVGSTIDAATIYAQTTGSGTYSSSSVTIDLEYSDLSTLNVFTGTMPTPVYSWSALAPNAATVPVTTSATLEVTAVIVTFTIKNGNDDVANYFLYIDDISVAYTAAAGNNPPSLSVNQPDGVGDSVTQGTSFNIDYDLSDAEDTATVDFYYETDGNGAGGTPIAACQNQPEGAGQTCAWDTTSVTPADYYVYGVADDTVNAVVTVVSSGVLTINAPANTPPALTVNQPAGGDDSVIQGASFNVDYDLSDTEDAATVDFYYETDGNGAGGTLVAACAGQPEGAGQTCGWDTTLITPGDYYIYGVADDGVNAVVTVVSSGVLTINAPAGTNTTAAGTATGSVGNAVIDVSAPYSDDDNADNSITISWGEGDCLTGNQTSGLHPASPYSYQISGLSNGTTYQVCVDYNDSDGVTGIDPQTLTGLTPISFNPMVHSSLSTGSSKWGGDWGTVTGKYGEFSCSTCHARKTGNIKRVKNSLNSGTADKFPIELDVGTINFLDTRDGSSGFGNDLGGHAVSDMICEGCHSQNKYHNYNTANNLPGGDLTHENLQDCVSCHQHSKGFGASCDTCHGNPPVTNDTSTTGLVFDPATTDATNPVSAGGHQAHAVTMSMACITCHKGNTMPTVSNSIQMGFEVNNANWSGFGATTTTGTLDAPDEGAGQMSASFSFDSSSAGTTINKVANNNLTCAVYCHGDWTGNGGQTATSWVGGSTMADDCNDCHGGVAATPPTAGSHQKHAGNGAGDLALACTKCHPSYSDTAHLDGDVAWALDTADSKFTANAKYDPAGAVIAAASGLTGAKAPSATYGTCSGLYCHSQGEGTAPIDAPLWGDATTAACGDCHAIAPATNAHPEHYAAKGWTADGSNCGTCHDETAGNHVNATPDILISLSFALSSCGTTPAGCHNGNATPVWTTGTAIACTDCHTVDGSNSATVANPVSGLHGNTTASVQDHDNTLTGGCEACHVKASISGHWNGTASNTVDYAKAAVGITSAMYTDATGTAATRGSCMSNTALASCHSDGGEWRRLWSTAADADIVVSPLPGQAVCNVCHGQFSTLTASTGWNEGTVHFRSGSGAAEDKGAIHTDTGDECEDCHAYDSAASALTHNLTSNNKIEMSGGGTTYTLTWGTNGTTPGWYCATCHNTKAAEDASLTATHTFFDSLAFPSPTKASPESVVYVNGASVPEGDCFGCHGDGTAEYWPQSVGTNQRDLSTDASFNDDGRHSLHMTALATRLGYTLPGDDAQQRAMCAYCHEVEDSDHMTKGVSEYADVFATGFAKSLWNAADAVPVATYAAATDTCSNVDCHNNTVAAGGTYGWYGSSSGTCTMCHTPGGASSDPNSGLHTGSAPTVSSQKHDDTLIGGCAACHAVPANGTTSTHINSAFSGNGSLVGDRTAMGLNTSSYVTSGSDNVGTCATNCHSGAGDNGSWARKWDSSLHYATTGAECNGCHGGPDGSGWNTGVLDHDQNWNTPTDAVSDEIIGNHGGNIGQRDRCRACHVYEDTVNSTYKDNASSEIGWAAAPASDSTYHGNGSIDFNVNRGYSGVTFTCSQTCHTEGGSHAMADSGWTVANVVGSPDLSCDGCHTGSGSGALKVGLASSHSTNTLPGSPTCESCHFTGHSARTTGTIGIVWDARTMGVDYTVDGKVYLKKYSGLEVAEAEICWNCHAAQVTPVEEFNSLFGAYETGTLDQMNWISAQWTSANFSYKNSNIRSVHETRHSTLAAPLMNPATPSQGATTEGALASISCASCHDVHAVGNNGYTPGAAPWLRGNWTSNPFKEDGAPQSTAHATVWGGVPRAGLGSAKATTPNSIGGWQIEQNNPGAYTQVSNYATHSGLCASCHDQSDLETAYTGHAAAVDGFTGGGSVNVFSTTKRGGAGNSEIRGYMMNMNSPATNSTKYVLGLRTEYYGDNVYNPWITAGSDPQVAGIAVTWGVTVDANTVDPDFHQFSCSKCHNPHASRLPRLMITNCLDVVHNVWDDLVAVEDPSTFAGTNSKNIADYTAKQLSYASTAANCHRYVDPAASLNEETNGSNEDGWNSVTPW